jgi:hypothetical protein
MRLNESRPMGLKGLEIEGVRLHKVSHGVMLSIAN